MKSVNDLAIVVMSCDKNKWMLDVFFKFFVKYWNNCEYPIYLSLDSIDYKYVGLDICVVTGGIKGTAWCSRLKKTLSVIEEEYILLLLDDFMIEENVDIKLLMKYLDRVKDNKCSNIILTTVNNEANYTDSKYKEWYHRYRYGRYKTSLQCGIWDKKVMQNLLISSENAWEFEIFGNIRSFLERDKFYSLSDISYKPIVYNEGFFAVQGLINLKEKERLENKTGIKIDIGEAKNFSNKMVRDNIAFIPRVFRRIKIIYYYALYYFLSKNKNNKATK